MEESKNNRILSPVFERKDKRGIFKEILNIGIWESLIWGKMKRGSIMGNHYHKETEVFLFLIRGKADIKTVNIKTKEEKSFIINQNEGVIFKPNEAMAIKYLDKSEFILMKSKRYDVACPDLYEYKILK